MIRSILWRVAAGGWFGFWEGMNGFRMGSMEERFGRIAGENG
jgi:hypothetical protein